MTADVEMKDVSATQSNSANANDEEDVLGALEREASLKKNPHLEHADMVFLLGHPEYDAGKKKELKKEFMEAVEKFEMAPYYKVVCKDLGWQTDAALLKRLEDGNAAKIAELDAAIKDAEENLGESEVRDALMKKSDYLCQIGDKTAAVSAMRLTYEKTVGAGNRMDLLFQKIRVGLFHDDHTLISTSIAKAKEQLEQGGDWDRKNRLKAYEGIYALSIRDFKLAADLLLDCVATFTSFELIAYDRLVFYAVLASMLTLDRKALHLKVIRGAEIQECLYGMPEVKEYLNGLYDCEYRQFFSGLAHIETRIKFDRYLARHYTYYVRGMRALAYKQLLSSYRSLTLANMATAFGVSTEFIDKELHRMISAGQVHCKVDRVRGIVETDQLDDKNIQYQSVVKHGDILLTRIQKLSRVINA